MIFAHYALNKHMCERLFWQISQLTRLEKFERASLPPDVALETLLLMLQICQEMADLLTPFFMIKTWPCFRFVVVKYL